MVLPSDSSSSNSARRARISNGIGDASRSAIPPRIAVKTPSASSSGFLLFVASLLGERRARRPARRTKKGGCKVSPLSGVPSWRPPTSNSSSPPRRSGWGSGGRAPRGGDGEDEDEDEEARRALLPLCLDCQWGHVTTRHGRGCVVASYRQRALQTTTPSQQ